MRKQRGNVCFCIIIKQRILKDKRIIEVDRTPAENLAYQVGWTTLVLKWEDDEKQRIEVKTPSDMFKSVSYTHLQSGSSRNWTERTSFCSVCMTETWWKAFLCGISTVIRYVFPRDVYKRQIRA